GRAAASPPPLPPPPAGGAPRAGPLPGDPGAGGMPDRVKCLHVLVAHSLASGPGVNPFGDEAIAAAGDWAARGRCVPDEPSDEPSDDLPRDPRGARA
ncbi:DUF501 domain-containing protein, partial [Frankia sp. AgB1.9]|uniref:DUF501 domain-containing protein n=1 Tax=Frankia sp. AgB1.9 TaxID=1836968 RepID=UPI001EE479A6